MANYPRRKVTDGSVNVAAASTLVLADNPQRKYALIINTSNTDVWLRLGSAAALNQGIFVARNGFAYEISANNLWTGEIYGIHGGSGLKLLSVLELS